MKVSRVEAHRGTVGPGKLALKFQLEEKCSWFLVVTLITHQYEERVQGESRLLFLSKYMNCRPLLTVNCRAVALLLTQLLEQLKHIHGNFPPLQRSWWNEVIYLKEFIYMLSDFDFHCSLKAVKILRHWSQHRKPFSLHSVGCFCDAKYVLRALKAA